jgi:ADP-ribose pyrophosphatase YjhB (NUDIX family)
MAQPSSHIIAAGGILQRKTGTGVEIVLVHRPSHNDWALPKGKLNAGEALETAALREVLEETACQSSIVRLVGKSEYPFRGRMKSVSFWLMELVEEHAFQPNDEIDALTWLSPREALQKLDYAQERELVKKAFHL